MTQPHFSEAERDGFAGSGRAVTADQAPGLKDAVKKDGPANPSPTPSSMRDYGPSRQARPDVR